MDDPQRDEQQKIAAAMRAVMADDDRRNERQIDNFSKTREATANRRHQMMTLAAASAGIVVPLLATASHPLGISVGLLKAACVGFILTLGVGTLRFAIGRREAFNDIMALRDLEQKWSRARLAGAAFESLHGPMTRFPPEIERIVDEARNANDAWQKAALAKLNQLVWWDIAFYGPYLLALWLVMFSFGG